MHSLFSLKNLNRAIALVSALFILSPARAQNLTATNLLCNYRDNIIGVDESPQLSWQLVSTDRGVMQTAYQIRVGTELKGGNIKGWVWDGWKKLSAQSVNVTYAGLPLQSKQRYFWQVKVWDNHGHTSPWSEVKYWEMGLLQPGDWQAKWIQTAIPTDGKVGPTPLFRKEFAIGKNVRSARLYITSHGLYEAKIDGQKVGNQFFTPGWTSYKKRLQYQIYDVTSMLKPGANAIGVTVGDGWYRGYLAFSHRRNLYGKEVGLLCQLEVEYADGKHELLTSDNSWKSSLDAPIRSSDIYNGEVFDSRLAGNAWANAGFNDKQWQNVIEVPAGPEKLVITDGPPVTQHERFKPVKFITTPKGETVIDFGQNLVGWVQVRVDGNAGDTVIIDHAEVLDKAGNFYTDNLRSATEEDRYVLNGTLQTLEPHFTYQGFRYVKIKGVKGKLDTNSLTAVALYSNMQPTGNFSCSNAMLNQLQHNIQWGQKGNFLDVPTDCPQRDERLGWTGDAEVFFNTAAYNMQVAGFFNKWLKDVAADQHADGNVPVVIPDVLSQNNAGSAGWSDVSTIIPWNYYMAYGDKHLLLQQYNSMKSWVNYMRSVSRDNLWNTGSHYGDWLFYSVTDDNDGHSAITDKNMIAQVFYANSTQLVINAANVLGNKEDVQTYTALLADIKKAFLNEYVTPSGRTVSSTQTAYVLALNFDMLPENLRGQAAVRLVDNIRSYGNHLTTGFLGTPYLCHVLTRFGYNDVAYRLLLQDTYPSWLYPIKMGATTIWERWDGIRTDGSFEAVTMNSFNHYAYGAIGDWMYRTITGINSDPSAPGYQKIIIAPKPGGGLTSASAELKTMYGKITSAWKIDNGSITLDITVPPNTSAKIALPSAAGKTVTEGSATLTNNVAISDIRDTANDLTLNAGSGTYHFAYPFVMEQQRRLGSN